MRNFNRHELKRMRERQQSERREKSPFKGTPIVLKKCQVPSRNGPCPAHPDFKIKKCPHGCLEKYLNMREALAGTFVMMKEDTQEENTV